MTSKLTAREYRRREKQSLLVGLKQRYKQTGDEEYLRLYQKLLSS